MKELQSLNTWCTIHSGITHINTAVVLGRRSCWLNSCATEFRLLFTCWNLICSIFDIYSLISDIYRTKLDLSLFPNDKLLIHVILSYSRIISPWYHSTTITLNLYNKLQIQPLLLIDSRRINARLKNTTSPLWFLTTTHALLCPVASIKLASAFSFSQPCSGGFHVATGRDTLAISFATNSLAFFHSSMIHLPLLSSKNTSDYWIDKLFSIDSIILTEPTIENYVPPCVRSLRTEASNNNNDGLAFSGVLSRAIRNYSEPVYCSWEISGTTHLFRIFDKRARTCGHLATAWVISPGSSPQIVHVSSSIMCLSFLFVLEARAFEASHHANIHTFGGTSTLQIFLHSLSLPSVSVLEVILLLTLKPQRQFICKTHWE
jgi:hypothetical protein